MIRIGQVIVSGVDIDQDTLNKLNNIPEVANGIDGEGVVTAPVVKAELEKYQTKSDMEEYAKTSDIPDVSDLVNKNELTNLATKDDISNFITRDDIPDVDLTTLDMYYNSSNKSFELKYKDELLSQVDVSDFVKDGMLDTARLEGTDLVIVFNTDSGKQPITIDLSKLIKAYTAGTGIQIVNNTISITENIATKDDIPSLDGYAKTSDIPDISSKADKSEIPSLDGYATEVYVDDSLDEINEALKKVVNGETPVGKEYTAGEGININDNVISADTTKLATKTDLEGIPSWEDIPNPNLFASKSDLETKADKSEIPDVSNFITRDDIPELPDTSNFATKDEIPTVPENVSAFNNDAGYLTEHQDLSDYALKKNVRIYSNPIQTCECLEGLSVKQNDVYMPTIGTTQYPKGIPYKYDFKLLASKTYSKIITFDDSIIEQSNGLINTKLYYIAGKEATIYNTKIYNIVSGSRDSYVQLFKPVGGTYNRYKENSSILCVAKDGTKSVKYIASITLGNDGASVSQVTTTDGITYNSLYGESSNKLLEYTTYTGILLYGFENIELNKILIPLNNSVDYNDIVVSASIVNIKTNATDNLIEPIWTPIKIDQSNDDYALKDHNHDDVYAKLTDIPNTDDFATKYELENKANKTEIPSLDGYATEEYVNNAVANAGGSGNSGNYLKLVDDLDTYEATEGEIVKYSGESNDKYIQGADYKYAISNKSMTITSNTGYINRLLITQCDNSNFDNYHLITPFNGNDIIIDNERVPSEPFMYIYNSHYTFYYLGNPELHKDIIVISNNIVQYGTITDVNGNNITITFENTNITVNTTTSKQLTLRLGVIEEIAKIVYIHPSSFAYNKAAFLFYDNNKLKMLMHKSSDNITISTPINITEVKVKHIELTDFCKRALNIEQ